VNCRLSAIAYHLPDRVEGLAELQRDNPSWDLPKITEKTGVKTRHLAAPDEAASDLAFLAGRKLLAQAGGPSGIDLLILVTQSPDYPLPTTACILQDRLGLSRDCMAFDVNLGCSGFVYALSLGASLIQSGVAHKGIILCADTYSKYIAADDRICRPIFSDGASAVLLEPSSEDLVGPFEFGTDGSGYDKLIVRSGGSRETASGTRKLEMQGSGVFLFTMDVVPSSIEKLLKRAGTSLGEVDLFVFHQASKLVIENLVRKLGLDPSKVFTNYEEVGNTVSATIPIALKQAASGGRLKRGDLVLLAGFGVGLSWGATLLRWEAGE
jgi:3-oxoacyl-[acyl-carrier-protein] synthase-3